MEDYYVKPKYKEGIYYDRAGGKRNNPSDKEIIETVEKHTGKKIEEKVRIIKEVGAMNGFNYFYLKFNFKKD